MTMNSLTLMIIIEIVLMIIIIITCNIKYDVDYEHYYYTIEGVQRKVKVKISLILPTIFTRYNVNGFVEELPQLPENRHSHACSALPATGVRPAQPTLSVQVLVVAGGRTGGQQVYTSSVLILLPGAEVWTPLASLPRPLSKPRASIVGGRLRVTGGSDGSSRRSEVMACEIVV